MHTARLTSPLDHERWCSNSFFYGTTILLVISSSTSPTGWCRTSCVGVQCEHTKRVSCPAKGRVVFIIRVKAQGACQEPSPTARERKRAHAPPKTHAMHMYFCTLAGQIHKGSHMRRLCCVVSTLDQVCTLHTEVHSARQEKDRGKISQRSFASMLDLPINTIQTLAGTNHSNWQFSRS
jgi:hypothetical protein